MGDTKNNSNANAGVVMEFEVTLDKWKMHFTVSSGGTCDVVFSDVKTGKELKKFENVTPDVMKSGGVDLNNQQQSADDSDEVESGNGSFDIDMSSVASMLNDNIKNDAAKSVLLKLLTSKTEDLSEMVSTFEEAGGTADTDEAFDMFASGFVDLKLLAEEAAEKFGYLEEDDEDEDEEEPKPQKKKSSKKDSSKKKKSEKKNNNKNSRSLILADRFRR